MADTFYKACAPVQISDDDIFSAMREISGYLDITPSDFKESPGSLLRLRYLPPSL
ncbi:MAG: hypothetical protein WC647_10745 [Desulfomonilaceae bacterium]|jgi:hypothetical protein